MSEIIICNNCNKFLPKIREEKKLYPARGYYYVSNNGRRWHGRLCPDCYRQDSVQKDRRLGRHKNRITDPTPTHKKAIDSEILVGGIFRRLGFVVYHSSVNGPDLRIHAGE